jgi:hypothetical protein
VKSLLTRKPSPVEREGEISKGGVWDGDRVINKDEIVEETRRNREDFAAQFNYDLDSIFKDLKEKEKAGKRKLMSFPSKKPVKMNTLN